MNSVSCINELRISSVKRVIFDFNKIARFVSSIFHAIGKPNFSAYMKFKTIKRMNKLIGSIKQVNKKPFNEYSN